MCLVDRIKKRNAKAFALLAKERIKHYQFSCFIDKPFFYIYSVDMMNEELKKYGLYILEITKTPFKRVFVVTEEES